MQTKLFIIIAIAVLVGAGAFVVYSRAKPQPSLQHVQGSAGFNKGEQAPEFVLTDFAGQTHRLSDFQGRAVVLDYWAAWCPFCVEEMPKLQEVQDKYKDKLVMIGVHRTDTEKTAVGQKFAADRGVSYLLVVDNDGSLYRAAGGFGMPVAVFIDKSGVVQEVKSGAKTGKEIEEKVEKLVNQ